MGHKVTVAYYPVSKGVTEQQCGSPTSYYGKVFKIPKELFSEDGQVDFEKEIGGVIEEVQEKGLGLVADEVTVERYEVTDIETGDMWVMYRVPCHGKDN